MDISLELIKAYENGYKDGKKDAIRHGKWIADEDSDIIFICSECNDISVFKKNYCRNCGAKIQWNLKRKGD